MGCNATKIHHSTDSAHRGTSIISLVPGIQLVYHHHHHHHCTPSSNYEGDAISQVNNHNLSEKPPPKKRNSHQYEIEDNFNVEMPLKSSASHSNLNSVYSVNHRETSSALFTSFHKQLSVDVNDRDRTGLEYSFLQSHQQQTTSIIEHKTTDSTMEETNDGTTIQQSRNGSTVEDLPKFLTKFPRGSISGDSNTNLTNNGTNALSNKRSMRRLNSIPPQINALSQFSQKLSTSIYLSPTSSPRGNISNKSSNKNMNDFITATPNIYFPKQSSRIASFLNNRLLAEVSSRSITGSAQGGNTNDVGGSTLSAISNGDCNDEMCICYLCNRTFLSPEEYRDHKLNSKLHFLAVAEYKKHHDKANSINQNKKNNPRRRYSVS